MLTAEEVIEVVNDVLANDAKAQWSETRIWRKQLHGELTKSWAPSGADLEYRDLMRKARTPWLEMGASVYADSLIPEGFTYGDVWDASWRASGMNGRFGGLAFDAVADGHAWLLTFPDEDGGVFMRPLSAGDTFGFREDDWDSEFKYVLHRAREEGKPGRGKRAPGVHKMFDDEAMYTITGPLDRPHKVTATAHEMGVNPVTMIPAEWASKGLPSSFVRRARNPYLRVVDAGFTLQMVGRYGAFPQKYQAGGEIAEDDDGNALIRPSVDSILHSTDPDSKFGTFAAADIDKAAANVDRNLQDVAAILHLPPHYMLGKVVNLASDAVTAVETAFTRKLRSIQKPMGEGVEQSLRKAAFILEHDKAAFDPASELSWEDHTIRPIGAAVDAALKLDTMGASKVDTFGLVPGWTSRKARENARGAYAAIGRTGNVQGLPATGGDAVTATATTSPADTTTTEGD